MEMMQIPVTDAVMLLTNVIYASCVHVFYCNNNHEEP